MSEEFVSESRNDESWAIAEQWFMRFIGVALLVLAVVSIFAPPYQATISSQLVRGMNIAITLVLGIGSLWSLYWSMDIQRLYNLIDGFKERGNTATYMSAVVQLIVGSLFGLELLDGNFALGLLGVVMLISAAFFLWRAQQISHFSGK